MKCEVCNSEITRGKRCRRCAAIHDKFSADGRSDLGAITKAMRQSLRGETFICFYTGLKLDISIPSSPFYRSIDHRTPGDRSDLVLCCMFVNEMKCDMNEEEFRTVVRQLAHCFETGEVLDLENVRFCHRRRNWFGPRQQRP